MSRHYSSSVLVEALRRRFGIHKPCALGWGEWDSWHAETKKKHPVGYFLTETLPDLLEKPVEWILDPIYDVRYYVLNRWVTRSHALTADKTQIRPGEWRDLGDRFLPCMFNELVNFVEVELAWHHCVWDSKAREKYCPPWWRRGWLRWRGWRCPAAGLAYLDWASGLVFDEDSACDPDHPNHGQPTQQALAAREIQELYQWWKEIYPQRPDPYDASGWTALCEKRRDGCTDSSWFLSSERTPEQEQETRRSLDQLHNLEAEYQAEDEAQLIRLIKVRNHLWT